MARIYYASSWRNKHQPFEVQLLRHYGHEVYDFRNPDHGMGGFHWSDQNWKDWTPREYREHLLQHSTASQGFMSDFRAMRWSDTCVLRLPSGRSAHLEAGWMSGAGKRTIICLDEEGFKPELMNLLLDDICLNITEVLNALGTKRLFGPTEPQERDFQ